MTVAHWVMMSSNGTTNKPGSLRREHAVKIVVVIQQFSPTPRFEKDGRRNDGVRGLADKKNAGLETA